MIRFIFFRKIVELDDVWEIVVNNVTRRHTPSKKSNSKQKLKSAINKGDSLTRRSHGLVVKADGS